MLSSKTLKPFYNLSFYIQNPLDIIKIWEGGMSFHGGLIGIILVSFLYTKSNKIRFLALIDLICLAAPIGIFLGRISNFLNGELWGRVSELPWAIVFKCAGPDSRHPSQIYEALLEGLCLFIILYYCISKAKFLNKPGGCLLYTSDAAGE